MNIERSTYRRFFAVNLLDGQARALWPNVRVRQAWPDVAYGSDVNYSTTFLKLQVGYRDQLTIIEPIQLRLNSKIQMHVPLIDEQTFISFLCHFIRTLSRDTEEKAPKKNG